MRGVEAAIATPALWFPGQSEEETNHEIHLMVIRSVAQRQFLNGEIDFPAFLDILESAQVEMDGLIQGWSEELVLV